MQPLYTKDEFKSATSRQLLPLRCLNCNRVFYSTKHRIYRSLNPNTSSHFKSEYCSRKCVCEHNDRRITLRCQQCHKSFRRRPSEIRKVKNHFCSQSCAGKWYNAHKTKGTRVSKLEVWLSKKLPRLYPSLRFHFNRRDTINAELDIYIPSLKLAFELNGIFHYEPIFGKKKFDSIQSNDQRKFQACIEHGIELCVIDTSSFTYFKEQRAMKFLNIVKNIIDSKIG